MAFKFDYDKSTLKSKMNSFPEKMGAALLMYSSTKAQVIEATMKKERPWTDRTNSAKALLNTKVSTPSAGTIRITLAHGVDYGIWLELANEKNYAIISPTIDKQSPLIIKDLNNFLSKIKL